MRAWSPSTGRVRGTCSWSAPTGSRLYGNTWTGSGRPGWLRSNARPRPARRRERHVAMAEYATSIDIDAPPDVVFSHLVTVEGMLAWMGQHARLEPVA